MNAGRSGRVGVSDGIMRGFSGTVSCEIGGVEAVGQLAAEAAEELVLGENVNDSSE